MINANSTADDRISPFDLVPGFEPTPEEERRLEIKRSIIALFSRLPDTATADEARALRERTIARMKSQGITDAADIFREVFAETEVTQ